MTTAEQVYEAVKPLPESLIREVLDFVHFLRVRRGVTSERAEELNLIYAQETSLKKVWDNVEDEVWNDVPTL
jgi:hypothetical protein